jgi:hypothetical protein
MALIFCPECGTQVSEKAQSCPKCAYPISQLSLGKASGHGTQQTNQNDISIKIKNLGLDYYYQQIFEEIHKSNGSYKGGWNWYAFFFSWIWLLFKGAYAWAITIFVGNFFGTRFIYDFFYKYFIERGIGIRSRYNYGINENLHSNSQELSVTLCRGGGSVFVDAAPQSTTAFDSDAVMYASLIALLFSLISALIVGFRGNWIYYNVKINNKQF